MRSFDGIAPVYDFLARTFFQKQWNMVQSMPVRHLGHAKKLLIVGGGTGKLLEQCASGQQIDYVELSQRMIAIARKRECSADVNFIYADYLSWACPKKYDAILFPFFLDCFKEDNLKNIIHLARTQLGPEGQIHVLDFQPKPGWRNLLVGAMYFFFRVTAKLEAGKLLTFKKYLEKADLKEMHQEEALNGWVKYGIYEILV